MIFPSVPFDVRLHARTDGRIPFSEWLRSLRDRRAAARIRVRLARVRLGNMGDCRSLGGGIWELRIDAGPGYRVYFARPDGETILVLCGGDKSSQSEDIGKAREFWSEHEKGVQEGGSGLS